MNSTRTKLLQSENFSLSGVPIGIVKLDPWEELVLQSLAATLISNSFLMAVLSHGGCYSVDRNQRRMIGNAVYEVENLLEKERNLGIKTLVIGGEMSSEAKRYLVKSFEESEEVFPVRLGNSPVKPGYSQEYL
ncbi:hypothetical protein Tco_1263989 [Tanacetum coccineum]